MVSVIIETLRNGNMRATGRIGGSTVAWCDGEPAKAKELCLKILNEVAFAHKVNGKFDMDYINLNDAAKVAMAD